MPFRYSIYIVWRTFFLQTFHKQFFGTYPQSSGYLGPKFPFVRSFS